MRPQFTIRTLLVGTLILACVCGGIVWNRQQLQRRIQHRQAAIAWLEDLTGPVSYYASNEVAHIVLNRRHLDETTWAYVSSLNDAHAVWLNETNVTGADLQRLSRFQKLELLSLCDTDLKDADLPMLRHLHKLEQLYLRGTGITSDSIETISRLPSLENLNLARTKVGDEAIPTLIKMQQLKTLNLYSSRISADGLSQLRRAMPNCQVIPSEIMANKAFNRSGDQRRSREGNQTSPPG